MSAEPNPMAQGGTIRDLIADSGRAQDPFTERMINEWVQKGLLYSPPRRSLGRGMGSEKAQYSANQRELFKSLLALRKQTKDVKVLALIPLVLWAFWGDDYVPTEQAWRALETSMGTRPRAIPKNRARESAHRQVKMLTDPAATKTNIARLERLLTDAMAQGGIADPGQMTTAIGRVFDPHNRGKRFIPPGLEYLPSIEPASLIRAAVRKQYATNLFLDSLAEEPPTGPVTYDHLETVRGLLQVDLIGYAEQNPLYAALSGPRLRDVVLHHEFQNLTSGIRENILIALWAVLQGVVPQMKVQILEMKMPLARLDIIEFINVA